MSDLHQAVQAEIDAHTPSAAPPFAAITARKRRRDRRNLAVAGAAFAATGAFVVVGVVPVLDNARDGGSGLANGPSTAASPDTLLPEAARRYELTYTGPVLIDSPGPDTVQDAARARAQACLRLPGTSPVVTSRMLPVGYYLRVDGQPQIDAFEQCVRSIEEFDMRVSDGTVFAQFGMGWVDSNRYEASTTGQKVVECAGLPGARFDGETQSSPPRFFVIFSGTADQKDRLKACLVALGGSVSEQGPPADDPITPLLSDARIECGPAGGLRVAGTFRTLAAGHRVHATQGVDTVLGDAAIAADGTFSVNASRVNETLTLTLTVVDDSKTAVATEIIDPAELPGADDVRYCR